jgi:hypothetical protein
MRELQSLELQAVNGGAGSSNVLIGAGIAAILVVGVITLSACRRSDEHEDHVYIVTNPDKNSNGTTTTLSNTN